ncbi:MULTISPECIES: trimeric intracellular cation channel family protein [Myroides]|uniref:Trimeric intracellular cation channel family protein n=1 Tax=Myroides albus TaxID=2562892 RepID=A0A6I3LFD1_9FLAO|nr:MULTISPECIES: trimeric intracellular cation channel family protein [Myroides]MTG97158.1 trimeric intracellular cation channel family protein [Myroides albus]MVX35155.1 trimeric intracellular cation channel family protein [Myroides sp. LoEW2-1]UVD78900.1 trimeric intracellular cation channel family protein [Myroides albus]
MFSFFEILDLLGTLAFAISGALAGRERRLDLFGMTILAFATAIGGGTIRDMMIGFTPVMWLTNLSYFYVTLIGVAMAIVFYKKFNVLRYSLFLFDTIGIAVFTLIGIEKGMRIGLHPVICVTLGTITACFGGVIRDILANKIPIIFRKEIYATACILGGGMYYFLHYFQLQKDVIYIATAGTIMIIRALSVKYKWSLPFAHD